MCQDNAAPHPPDQPGSSLVCRESRKLGHRILPEVSMGVCFPQEVWCTSGSIPLFSSLHDLHCRSAGYTLQHSLEVYVQRFWMIHHGHPTPKRSIVWSTSPYIRLLDLGALIRAYQQGKHQVVRRYRGKDGRRKFTGNRLLKGTGMLG